MSGLSNNSAPFNPMHLKIRHHHFLNPCLTCGRDVPGVSLCTTYRRSSGRNVGAEAETRPPTFARLARVREQGSGCCSCLLRRPTDPRILKLVPEKEPGTDTWECGQTLDQQEPRPTSLPHTHLNGSEGELLRGAHSPVFAPLRGPNCSLCPRCSSQGTPPLPCTGAFSDGPKQLPSCMSQGQEWQLASQFLWPQHPAQSPVRGECLTNVGLMMTDVPMSLRISPQGIGGPGATSL